ncbi:MAG: MBL fold metallo-hydrolase, partial [Gemmatimonadota bacterium]
MRKLVHHLIEVRAFTGGAFAQTGYLLRCTATGETAIVDPGATAGAMVTALREGGHALGAVFLTHAHIDHVEGLGTIRDFSDAPIFLHPEARPSYDFAPQVSERLGLGPMAPLPPPDRDFTPGTPVQLGERSFEVRFTPGHAPGHVTLYDAECGLALVGDVIFSKSIGRTDLPGGD